MEVHCKFQHINFTFEPNRNLGGYTCRVENVIFKENCRRITIFGNHAEGKDNSHVVGVIIDNLKHLVDFPRGFGEIFPNLIYFQIRRCGLKEIRNEDFLDLGKLRGLWLSENLLNTLPPLIFCNLQGLKHLSVYKNHLKFIDEEILNPLKNLERANFGDNTCINMTYDKDKDPPLKLQELIKEIHQKCQFPLPAVQRASNDLFENRLKSLENDVKTLTAENQNLKAQIGNMQKSLNQLRNFIQ